MAYAYAGLLYNSGDAALAACAHDWLTAGGNNGDATVRGFLADMNDERMADEMIQGFGLDQQRDQQLFAAEDDENLTQLEEWECDRADVVRAMRDLRNEILSVPVEADEEEGEDDDVTALAGAGLERSVKAYAAAIEAEDAKALANAYDALCQWYVSDMTDEQAEACDYVSGVEVLLRQRGLPLNPAFNA